MAGGVPDDPHVKSRTSEAHAGRAGRHDRDVRQFDRRVGGRDLPACAAGFFELAEVFGWPVPRAIVKKGLVDRWRAVVCSSGKQPSRTMWG
jgi:hypothetical protein